jgi:hypothetical protein
MVSFMPGFKVRVLVLGHALEGGQGILTAVVGSVGGMLGAQQLVLVTVEVPVGVFTTSQASHLLEIVPGELLPKLLIRSDAGVVQKDHDAALLLSVAFLPASAALDGH